MTATRLSIACCVASACLAWGCKTPSSDGWALISRGDPFAAGADGKAAPDDKNSAAADRPHPYMHLKEELPAAARLADEAQAPAAKKAPADRDLTAELSDLLAASGEISPRDRDEILRAFDQTPPTMQPMVLQTLRGQVAYQRRRVGKESTDASTPKERTVARKSRSRPVDGGRSRRKPEPREPETRGADEQAAVALRSQRPGRGESRSEGGSEKATALPPATANGPAELNDRGEDVVFVTDASGNASRHTAAPGGADEPGEGAISLATFDDIAAVRPAAETESENAAEFPDGPAAPQRLDPGQTAARRLDWQASLDEAILALAGETRGEPRTPGDAARQARLRLLQLVAGDREQALKPIAGLGVAEQDFWSAELFGLSTWLDDRRLTEPDERAAAAHKHLSKAVGKLGEASMLVVRGLEFCTEVSSYGIYTPFKTAEFEPNQQVLLYAEVENFKCEETEAGWHTSLRGSYGIVDSQGRRVAAADFAPTEETCRNPRRDFFIAFLLRLPDRIYPGDYTLKLTVVDRLGEKIAESTIDFAIERSKTSDKGEG